MAKTTDNSNTGYEKRKKKLFLIPRLFLVFATVFLIITIFFGAGDSVETFTALKGSIDEYVLADGYVFRDQELVSSDIDGYLECNAKEGARVNEGDVVATVYNGQVDPAVTERISTLKSEIAKLETEKGEADVYAASAVKIELNIADETRSFSQIREEKSFSDITERKSVINEYIAKKQAVSGEGKTNDERLNDLKSELSSLENSIGGQRHDIVAPCAGVFSSKIDGYEKALSLDMMADATPSYLNKIKKEEVSYSSNVAAGENVCKIIDNYEWYFVGVVSDKEAIDFEVGSSVRLKFYELSDTVIKGEITAISKTEGGKVAVTIHTTKYIESIYSTSKASVEIVSESSVGIKIPSSALRVIDGKQGVYVVRLGVARFIPVTLLYNNKEWAVIQIIESNEEPKVKIYDEVIVNTKGVEDGKVVRQ